MLLIADGSIAIIGYDLLLLEAGLVHDHGGVDLAGVNRG